MYYTDIALNIIILSFCIDTHPYTHTLSHTPTHTQIRHATVQRVVCVFCC